MGESGELGVRGVLGPLEAVGLFDGVGTLDVRMGTLDVLL
eukprot:COSAG02_NODE_36252_length_457_cov_0.740223_2_plen_39_part_01